VDESRALPSARSSSAERNALPVRILVTVKPRMYRESIALTLHHSRPHFEVLLAPAASPDGRTGAFRPHMLVRNDTDGADMDRMGGVRCWVEVLYSDGMDARVSLDGEVWNIADISNEDLLGIADRTEALMLEGAPFDSEEASPGRA
jgi:hypothetical protein